MGFLVFVGMCLLIIGLMFGVDWVIYKVYNSVCVPDFHWHYLPFWHVVGIIILISFVGGCIRSSITVKK